MNEEFRVLIHRDPFSFTLGIAFVRRSGLRRYVARPVELQFEEIQEGEAFGKPTLQLDWDIAELFLKAMAEALDEQGVKTDKDAKVAGTLEATRAHLSDLRQMLKLK